MTRRTAFFCEWVVVAVAGIVVLVTAGVRSAPVYRWVFAAHMIGAAIAAWVAGVVRGSVGDYATAFVAAGWIAIIAGFAALAIRRPGSPATAAAASASAGPAAA
jgi:hypothetical protein